MKYKTYPLYIITGGPGAGKTTLLNELESIGYRTVPEEGRRIIKEQILVNGEGLPWMNKKLFGELMFEASVRSYQEVMETGSSGPVFFDRGILDSIGYLRLENIPVPEEMTTIAREMIYHKNVFILPPWREIYENDPERKQNFEEAVSTYHHMKEIYLEYGYHLIEVPEVPVEKRAGFILEIIEADYTGLNIL
ncbi:ATPase [Chryseobacterium arthrosphaerae]|uniref:AAA family ATPase n=1 Tax=Chryseobacterium arthrosphaerae TaxID=651561 RepID=UPI000F4FE321|nr:AAA family ATPase [Chryseobacterium arthrosphaerae]AYZ11624.1 ATPase [Chryseobacterium arthrosphaerae]